MRMKFLHQTSGAIVDAEQFSPDSRPYPPGILSVTSQGSAPRFFLEPCNGSAPQPLSDSDWIVTADGGTFVKADREFRAEFELLQSPIEQPVSIIPTTFVRVTRRDGREVMVNSSKVLLISPDGDGSILTFDSVLTEMAVLEPPGEVFNRLVLAPVRAGQ